MKNIVIAIVALTAVILIAYSVSPDKNNQGTKAESSDDLTWVKFDTGLKLAAKDNKYVMAYFWRPRCPWCTKMENGTFSNQKIIDLINAYFTPVKVNTGSKDIYKTEKGEISVGQLARSLRIRGVPATYFLKADGTVLTGIPGYKSAEIFELILRYFGEEHYKEKSFEEYQKEPKEDS